MEFTNLWLRLWAHFQVEDLFIALQSLKFSLHWLFDVTKDLGSDVQDLLVQIHTSLNNLLSKHDSMPLKTWEMGKLHKLLLKIPASKSYPQASKIPLYTFFRLNKRIPTSPEDLASFWDQIPLQMAKISSKNQFWSKNQAKSIKNTQNHSIKPTFYIKYGLNAPNSGACPSKHGHMNLNLAKRWPLNRASP